MKPLLTLICLLCFGFSFGQSRPRNVQERRITVSGVLENNGPGSLRYLQYQTDSIRKTTGMIRSSVMADSMRLDSVASTIMLRSAINAGLASGRASVTRDSITLDSVRRFYTPLGLYNTTTASIRAAITRDSILIDTLQKRVSKDEAISATHITTAQADSKFQLKGAYASIADINVLISAASQLSISNDSLSISGGNRVKLPLVKRVDTTITVSQTATALVAISVGDRDVPIVVPGLLSTDNIAYAPVNLPSNIRIVGVRSVANNLLTMIINAPLLQVGTPTSSYSFQLRLTEFKR